MAHAIGRTNQHPLTQKALKLLSKLPEESPEPEDLLYELIEQFENIESKSPQELQAFSQSVQVIWSQCEQSELEDLFVNMITKAQKLLESS